MSAPLDASWLEQVLARWLPREAARWRLGLARADGPAAGELGRDLWARLELVRLDPPPSPGAPPVEALRRTNAAILVLAKHREAPAERVACYLEGWLAACSQVLSALSHDHLGAVLPVNLAAPRVLDLARPRTAAEFERALLAPARLGKLLGPAPGRFLGGSG